MQTMRRIGVQINGKLVGSCDSISKVSSPLFKDILDPWFDIEGFVPAKSPLNENQQIVLEWLKKKYKTTDIEPIELIWRLRVNSNSDRWRLQPPYKNYRYLTEIAQFQVLAAFAEWGMEEAAE
ncbi:hypothetical protein [Enterococcus gilvus]|uniref:hypothetical protein n=1 Tax=Enterococcus gilvus TaxID=160453 RepID=UPI003ED902E1